MLFRMAKTEKLAEQHDKEPECVVDFSAQLISLALVIYGGRFVNCILHAANFVITGGNFTQVLGDFNLVEQHDILDEKRWLQAEIAWLRVENAELRAENAQLRRMAGGDQGQSALD
ncbi:hypothetical protein CVT26_011615 [Gymnopilus dilepis]|uniref:Uncharacterized protein n=1 Tax=Gymnopilus dilepis TaxID=231916 RepID=A0A409YQK7_9AGAR|nr:hypothetical protein CVT26_011615 [Gymnopilus dilepis]